MNIVNIQVLKVENEEKTSARTGNKYIHFAARCILLDDAGQVETVGVISSRNIDKELRDKVQPGLFRASFGLRVPDYGDNKGEIVSMLVGLVAVPASALRASPVGAAAPVIAPPVAPSK